MYGELGSTVPARSAGVLRASGTNSTRSSMPAGGRYLRAGGGAAGVRQGAAAVAAAECAADACERWWQGGREMTLPSPCVSVQLAWNGTAELLEPLLAPYSLANLRNLRRCSCNSWQLRPSQAAKDRACCEGTQLQQHITPAVVIHKLPLLCGPAQLCPGPCIAKGSGLRCPVCCI